MEKEGSATLFTSEKNKKKLLIIVFSYVGITAFIALFGAVYENFSHHAYTPYMLFAWAWVLGFGLIPHLLLYLLPIKRIPGILSGSIYNFGVAMITSRSIFIGVVTIANTPNPTWGIAYLVVSIIALKSAVLLYVIGLFLDKKNINQ